MSSTTSIDEVMTFPAPDAPCGAVSARARQMTAFAPNASTAVVDGPRHGRPYATGGDRTEILGMTGANAKQRLLSLMGSRSG